MKYLIKTFSILASALILLSSCDKSQDSNNPNPSAPVVPENNIQALQDYFSSNMESAKQSFSIDATAGGTITSISGTEITEFRMHKHNTLTLAHTPSTK